jgi:hypothetical protein
VKEWVKLYDKKTKKVTSLKGATVPKGSSLIFQLQFLVKDVSTQLNNNTYRILLYTHEGLGEEFFKDIKPDNVHKNDALRKKLENYADMLTKFNSWVDCIVERRNGFYFIRDTSLIF